MTIPDKKTYKNHSRVETDHSFLACWTDVGGTDASNPENQITSLLGLYG